MIPANFADLAARLEPLYLQRAAFNYSVWQAEQEVTDRERALTPPEGWPGKNDEQRRASRETALAGDPNVQEFRRQITEQRASLAVATGQIDALEAARRAAEWQVRARLADVLAQTGLKRKPADGDAGEYEPAFEDGRDAAVDGALDNAGQVYSNVDEDFPVIPDVMPF